MSNYKYSATGEDADNPCIMIPRYRAEHRVGPDGKRYPVFTGKADENDLVPVRSIISKQDDFDTVTPDLISDQFKDLTDGTAIGTSFATSFTEGTTQGALGLKHGGHAKVLNKTTILRATKTCKLEEDGKWMYLKYKGGADKYPRPDNLVTAGKDEYKKGDIICSAYETTSPIYKLNAVCSLMRAKNSPGSRYYEKESITTSDCYCYEEGDIKYKYNQDYEEIEVWIGNIKYDYNPDCIYYFPDGTHVNKFDRICSGVINMGHAVSQLGNNINDIYLIFRKQFFELWYVNDGYPSEPLSKDAVPEDIIEMLFSSLTHVDIDTKSKQIENVEFLGSQKGVMDSKSFFTLLSYGFSSRVVDNALKGDVKLKDDVMTETVLGLLLNEKLDENK